MKNKLIPNIQKIGNYSFDSNLLYQASDIIQKRANPQGNNKIFMTPDYKMVSRNPDGSYKFHTMPTVNEQIKSNNSNDKTPNIQKVRNVTFDSNTLREPTKTYMEMYLPNYKGKDKVLTSEELIKKFGYRRNNGVYEGLVVRNQNGSYKQFNIDDYLPGNTSSQSNVKKETPQWLKDRASKNADTVKFYETLNYKNWGVKDYSNYSSKDSAFINARKNGEKEFMYKGVRYNTNYAGTPQQQLKETGITNDQLQNRSNLNKKFANNLYPFGYGNPVESYIFNNLFNITSGKRIITNNILKGNIGKNERKVLDDTKRVLNIESDEDMKRLIANRMDAFNMYSGLPQKNNTFAISNYTPSTATEKNKTYYTFNNETKDKISSYLYDWANNKNPSVNKEVLTDNKGMVMGNFTASLGKDNRGEYISYYDKWDLDPLGSTLSPSDFGKPFEMYDRLYVKKQGDKYVKMNYTDNELLKLNPNSKNFNVKSLQEELHNKGYDMWTSRTKSGFDGIYGNDTKSALAAYQKGISASEYNMLKGWDRFNK